MKRVIIYLLFGIFLPSFVYSDDFKDIVGEWKIDWNLAETLYRNQKSTDSDEREWQVVKNEKLASRDGLDVTITERELRFQRDGEIVIEYPIIETINRDTYIVVAYKHPSGIKSKIVFHITPDGRLMGMQSKAPEDWLPVRAWKRMAE